MAYEVFMMILWWFKVNLGWFYDDFMMTYDD